MFRSLYFKIVLIFVIFIVTVMSVVSSVLIYNVLNYYRKDFFKQMDNAFSSDASLRSELELAFAADNPTTEQKNILASYSRSLGIDQYRNYYILSSDGTVLAGSDAKLGEELTLTPNILSSLSGRNENSHIAGTDYSDYALSITDGVQSCIIYVMDSLDEVENLCWIMFSIIIQALFIGLIIAITLSFFLAKAITSPIQNITEGAQRISKGDFDYALDVHNRDEIGTLTETFNYMRDTLKFTLEQVDGERRKLETVFSCLRDAVLAFTEDGNLLQANESSHTLLGNRLTKNFTAADMCDCFEINIDGDKLAAKTAGGTKVEDKSYIFHDVVFDNRVFEINLGAFSYTDTKNRHTGIIAVLHDVTGRYELDKSRREFVANVSHELRTPLAAIKGACETVLEDDEIEHSDREYFMNMAVSECDRMKRIVSDLLVLSRLDNNRTEWQITEFNIGEVIHHICEVIRGDLDAHHHRLTLRVAKNIPIISADREKVEQVLINIVSNSVKYTPDNGKIIITALCENTFVNISVTDNGLGIPEEDLPHIFERFYRVDKSRTTGSGGTGLGLAIAREIITAHGGDIIIKSKYGQGSTVTVSLPLKTELSSSGRQS